MGETASSPIRKITVAVAISRPVKGNNILQAISGIRDSGI
jgi:hypothetical protein